MKTETQRVTITAVSRTERATRMRELMFRGYTLVENGLREQRFTKKHFTKTKNERGPKTIFDTDSEITKYIAIMTRVAPCKS